MAVHEGHPLENQRGSQEVGGGGFWGRARATPEPLELYHKTEPKTFICEKKSNLQK